MQVPVLSKAVRGAVVALAGVHLRSQAQYALQRRLRVTMNLQTKEAVLMLLSATAVSLTIQMISRLLITSE